jgi:YD repeat-containing protein
MVAIITGTGVGLERSSASVLGSRGLAGSAALGRAADNVFVNAASGNLVITRQDEFLVGVGPDIALNRTYNSQALVADGDNGDNWRASAYRKIVGASGAATVTRIDWDGSETVFTLNGTNSYICKDGAGAYDTLSWSGTQWTWTDGNSRIIDIYDSAGKLLSTRDLDGNSLTYNYAGSLIANVTDQNGERTDFVYGGAGGTQLLQITTQASSGSVRVRYGYDGSNRLWTVTVDLSPNDSSIADAKTYVTTYTYDGTSKRVASIGQSDGSLLQIGYATTGTEYRVVSLTQTAASGVTRVTGLYYDMTSRVTKITDPLGGVTTMTYDVSGNLTQLVLPTPAPGAAAPTTSYTYNGNGDVLSMTENGRRTDYEYDPATGNLTLTRDAGGNTVARTYGSRNELLTSTQYLVPDPDGAGAGAPSAPATTRYAYDAENHLRFAVSAEGDVTEYQYNAPGLLSSTIVYTASKYDVSALGPTVSIAESTLVAWANAIADKSTVRRTDTVYDFRGNVWTVTRYSVANSAGVGLTSSDYSRDTYVYDQAGLLASRVNNASAAQELFFYDGLGRLTGATDMTGAATTFLFNDAASTTTATIAGGLTRIVAYNKAGELISVTESGSNVVTGVTSDAYDALGRLRMETGPAGRKTYHVYDNAGRKVADITTDGSMTEYVYDADGRLVKTIGYVGKLSGPQIDLLDDFTAGGAGGAAAGAQGIGGGPIGSSLVSNGSFETPGDNNTAIASGFSSTTLPAWTKINSQTYERVTSGYQGVAASDGGYWLDLDSVPGTGGLVTFGSNLLSNPSFDTPASGATVLSYGLSSPTLPGWFKYNAQDFEQVTSGSFGVTATDGNYWLELDSVPVTGYVTTGSNLLINGSFDTSGAFTNTATGRANTDMPGWTKTNPEPFEQVTSGQMGVTATDGAYWLDMDSVAGGGTNPNLIVNGSFEQSAASYTTTGTGRYNDPSMNIPGWTKAAGILGFEQLNSGVGGTTATDGAFYLDTDSTGAPGSNMDFSQTVSGMTAGAHTLKFDFANYAGFVGDEWDSSGSLEVYWNGALIAYVGSVHTNMVTKTYTVTAVTGNNTLRFRETGVRDGVGCAIDNVRLTSNAAPAGGGNMDFYQNVTLSAGQVVQLQFDHANRTTAASGSFEVLWNDQVVPPAISSTGTTMLTKIYNLTAIAGTNKLRFRSTGTVDTLGASLDNVRLFATQPAPTGGNMDIYQTVSGLPANQTLQLQFDHANRTTSASGSFEVLWNDVLVAPAITSTGTTMLTKTYNLTGSASGTNTLRFRGTGTVDALGASIDNVRLFKTQTDVGGGNMDIYQSVSGVSANQALLLQFDHANRTTSASGSFEVLWNDVLVTPAISSTGTTMLAKSFNITGSASGTNTLRFRGTGTVDALGASIDNVRLFATQGGGGGGGPIVDPLAGLRPSSNPTDDRYQWQVYDAANRLIETIDGAGSATVYTYDGASRLVATTSYANQFSTAAVSGFKTTTPTSLTLPTPPDPTNDRVARNFYDKNGRLIGALDAEGALTESIYDGEARLIETIRYATWTNGPDRAAGTFTVLKAFVTATTNVKDVHNWFVYDNRGLLRGSIDGEGDLTRYHYNAAGHIDQMVRGQKLDPAALIATRPTFASLPTSAGSQIIETTNYTRDGLGRMLSEARVLADGSSSTTTYSYNQAGLVTARTDAFSTADARTMTHRYDVRGNLTGELAGEGSAALAALGANPSQAAVDNVYATWGTIYTYDAADRLIAKTEANGVNAAGNRTLYYYTSDDYLAFQVNALGEVVEYRYNARGERTDTVAYAARIAAGSLSGLSGGQLTTPFLNLITGITSATLDSLNHFDYNVTGTLKQSIDALSSVTAYTYNAFRELKSRVAPLEGAITVQTDRNYDRRGLLTSEKRDAPAGGLQLETISAYDAFGRAFQVTDPAGRVRKTDYDRAGRVVLLTDARNATQGFTYDGRGNVFTSTDRTGAVTQYGYDAFSRTMTVTTPSSIVTTIKRNAHGQTISIKDGALRETLYTYDKSGSLKTETNAASNLILHNYDTAGRLKDTIDARGSKTSYNYDAANRLLTEKVNDGGLNLVTAYEFDGKGLGFKITDPANRITLVEFDKNGRKTAVVVNSGGLALRTEYTYDKSGRMLTVTEGAGTAASRVTKYEYDKADRLFRVRVDPNGLNLTTEYSYDKAGNVARRTDAAARITTYAYDAENRLTRTLDAENGVAETSYDNEGRVTGTRRYATAGSASAAANGAFTISVAVDNARDHVAGYVYDGDGRLRFSIDGASRPTEFIYDGAGNVVRSIDYAGTIAYVSTDTIASVQSKIANAGLAGLPATRTTRAVYDAANRRAFTIDAENVVTAFTYDGSGYLIKQVRYFNPCGLAGDQTLAGMQNWAATYPHAQDRTSRILYDGASHTAFLVDAENYVTEYQYDAASRLTKQIRHASNGYTINDSTTQASLAAQIGAPLPSAAVIGYTYDTAGRLTDTTNPTNSVTHLVLDAVGQATDTIIAYNVPAEASTTRRVFDKAGRVQSETRAFGTLEATTTSYQYDGMGRARFVTDGRNVTTEYIYDGLGHVIHEIQPLNATQTAHTYKEYDRFGNLVKLTDPRNNAAFFYYDALNRMNWQVDPEGYVTKTTHTIGNAVASVTRYAVPVSGATTTNLPAVSSNPADAITTTFTRDKLDRLTGITNAESQTESYGLNAFGDRINVTNRINGTTVNTYDKRGLLLTETLPVGSTNAAGTVLTANIVNKFEYDARGNRTKNIEAFGLPEVRTTNFVYDNADRLKQKYGDQVYAYTSVAPPVGGWTTPTENYTYNARGDLIETVASWGARTLSYYDRVGRKTAEVQATTAANVGTLSTWTYDANGNVGSARVHSATVTLPTLAGGDAPTSASSYRETIYTYDSNNRLTHSKVVGLRSGEYGSSYISAVSDIILQKVYDLAGNLVQEIDGRLISVYSFYDKAGRRIAKVDQENYLTSYTLDGEGNVKTEERFANPVAAVAITSDPVALRSSVLGGLGNRVTEFTYDKNGRRKSETRLNVDGKTLSGTGQLIAAGAHAQILYDYNGLGQVTKKTEANGDFAEYGYDATGRQTSVQSPFYTDFENASVRRRTEIAYDGLGNVTRSAEKSKTGVATDDRLTKYTYSAGGRLDQMTDPSTFVRTYRYDAAGNVVIEVYSRANSTGTLTEANAYRYDLLNRLTAQSVMTWTGSVWTDGDVTQLRYNTFGEITGQGINVVNNAWQETFDYDAGGRMWRSTSGDGSVRLYAHDKAGNANLVIASAGDDLAGHSIDSALAAYAGGGSGVATTITLFDKRGQAVGTLEPQRRLAQGAAAVLISTSRLYNAYGEVRRETDARGKVTDYSYNTSGKLTKRELPTADYTTETGDVVSGTRATDNYSYDLSGRLIGVEDAYGNDTTRRLLTGTGYGDEEATVLAEYHPDGGIAARAVDEYGNVRTSTDEINRVTGYAYDKMGRLTQLNHAGGLIDYYGYDSLGQRTQHWNNYYGSGVVDLTDYDARGRVTKLVQASGTAEAATISTTYAWDGNLITNGLGTFGGWIKTTIHGGRTNNYQSTETTDYFGRVIGKTDLGGRTYTFTYNKAGWVTQQTSSANQNLTFTYFNIGKAATITDSYVDVYYSPNSVQSTFAYDEAGNRVFEGYTKTSYQYDWETGYTIPYTQSLQAATVTYDALGRMKSFDDTGVTGSNPASVDWEYDQVGNIRRVLTTYTPVGMPAWMGSDPQTTDRWYTYDSMNRMAQVMGYMYEGQIGNDISTVGSGLAAYDKAGQRTSFTTNFFEYDGAGSGFGKFREDYTYTAAGYLQDVKQVKAYYTDIFMTELGPWSAPVLLGYHTRDLLGRLIAHAEYSGPTVVYSRSAGYNALSQMTWEYTSTKMYDNSTLTASTTFDYRAETWAGSDDWTGEYQGGVVTHVRTNSWRTGFPAQPVANTTNSYVWWDDSQLSVVTNQQSPSLTYTSSYSYDENGRLASVYIQDGRPRSVNYVTDLNGQVMSRTEYSSAADNPKEIYYYFNGIRVGDVGNNGPSQTDYVTAIGQRGAAPQTGPFNNEYGMPGAYSDFDQAFSPMNPGSEAHSGASYTVREGDSLRSIAHMVWGDPDMWYLIAEANGLTGTSALAPGQTLKIPAKVTNIHNNSQTFRVYDPNKAIGDNSPTQAAKPKPPKRGGGCGMLGKIILIAIAVAITIILKVPVTNLIAFGSTVAPITAGTVAVASAGAAIVGAAVTGAIASVVSQGIGVATGIQEKFSWKGVAMSALSAGITQGVGNGTLINGAGKFANDVARGVLINAATQGVAVATGLQKKFDWAGIAVAGVVAGVTGALSRALPGAAQEASATSKASPASHMNRFASSLGGAVAGAGVRSIATGTSFGDNILAVLPDVIGATIGNIIGEALNDASLRKAKQTNGAGEAKSEGQDKNFAGATEGSADDYNGMGGPGEPFIVRGAREGHTFEFSENGTGTTLNVILAGADDPALLLDLANQLYAQNIRIEDTINDLVGEIGSLDPAVRLAAVQNAYNILNSPATVELSNHYDNQRLSELINEFNLGIASPLIIGGYIYSNTDFNNPMNHTTYTIRRGDTLSKIASRLNGLSVDYLASHNNISNPDRIIAGATIRLPTQEFIAAQARRVQVFIEYLDPYVGPPTAPPGSAPATGPFGRFGSMTGLQQAAGTEYQRLVDIGFERGSALWQLTELGGLNQNQAIGRFMDDFARIGMRNWFAQEGIQIGANGPAQIFVNARLYEQGGFRYRIPDLRVGDRYFDASLAPKSAMTAQVIDFYGFGNPSMVTITRPTSWGGAYDIPRPPNPRPVVPGPTVPRSPVPSPPVPRPPGR